MTGTATVDAEGYTGNATYTQHKQPCTLLTNSATLSGLSGAEESYQCYQIDIPGGVTNFNVQTSGGTGDCDLGVGYHRPDFSVQVSEGDFTQEQVQVSAPQSGLWYILLMGYTNFSGVNLSVSFQAVPAPIANFKADPVRGGGASQRKIHGSFNRERYGTYMEFWGWIGKFRPQSDPHLRKTGGLHGEPHGDGSRGIKNRDKEQLYRSRSKKIYALVASAA